MVGRRRSRRKRRRRRREGMMLERRPDGKDVGKDGEDAGGDWGVRRIEH